MTGYLNDLWRYQVTNNTWTWVSGSNESRHRGDYESGTDSVPSARSFAIGWFDTSTNEIWLFGGYGYDSKVGTGACEQPFQYHICPIHLTCN